MKDPNNTRDTVPRRGSPLWIFFLCVTAAGLAVFAAALAGSTADDLNTIVRNPAFWLLGCFVVVGELRPIITPGLDENNGASTATTFSFAALLYFGLPAAAVLQVSALLI